MVHGMSLHAAALIFLLIVIHASEYVVRLIVVILTSTLPEETARL
jgi:hypothetical protein